MLSWLECYVAMQRTSKDVMFESHSVLFFSFLAALGLRCCTWASSSCTERGLLFVVVHRLLIVVASHCSGFSC